MAAQEHTKSIGCSGQKVSRGEAGQASLRKRRHTQGKERSLTESGNRGATCKGPEVARLEDDGHSTHTRDEAPVGMDTALALTLGRTLGKALDIGAAGSWVQGRPRGSGGEQLLAGTVVEHRRGEQ